MITLTLTTTTDVSQMVDQLARQACLAAGEPAPSSADLEHVREHVAISLDVTRTEQSPTLAAQLRKALPAGIRLTKLDTARSGLTMKSATTLELDDVSLVPQVVFQATEGQPPLKPFADFTVRHDQSTITLAGRAPALPEGTGSLALELKSPRPPIKHNATKASGGDLEWTGSGGFEMKVVFARR